MNRSLPEEEKVEGGRTHGSVSLPTPRYSVKQQDAAVDAALQDAALQDAALSC
jgi:hypothetical protein